MSYLANSVGESQWIDVPGVDVNLPANNIAPERAELAGLTGIEAWAFEKGRNESICGSFVMPHGYKAGTDVTVHIDAASNSATNGNVYWELKYAIGDHLSEFSELQTVHLEQAVSVLGENSRPVISHGNFPAISCPTLRMGMVIRWKLTRLADAEEDTHAADVLLFHLNLHARVDYLGSRQTGVQ